LTRARKLAWRCLVAAGVTLAAGVCLASASCDSENACASDCPTGTRFDNDGTCKCYPFDAGYCATSADCADAYCPASSTPDACGGGQLWSTTICGCYSLPDAGLPPKG
jgi:hypothetical protein